MRLKNAVAPPLDIHKKHLERITRLMIMNDVERVDTHLRAK
jgi:hypothetical protein